MQICKSCGNKHHEKSHCKPSRGPRLHENCVDTREDLMKECKSCHFLHKSMEKCWTGGGGKSLRELKRASGLFKSKNKTQPSLRQARALKNVPCENCGETVPSEKKNEDRNNFCSPCCEARGTGSYNCPCYSCSQERRQDRYLDRILESTRKKGR